MLDGLCFFCWTCLEVDDAFIYLFIYFFTFSAFIVFLRKSVDVANLTKRACYSIWSNIAQKNVKVQSLCRFSHKGIFFKTEDSRRWRGGRRAMVTVWVKKRGQLVNLNSTGHRGNVHDPAKRSQPHRLVNHSHTHARAHTHTRTPPQPRGQSSWVNWGYQEPLEGGEERGEKVVF